MLFLAIAPALRRVERTIAPALSRDGWLVILARAIRTFGYGFTSVMLGVALANIGLAPLQIGIVITMASVGSICFSLLMGFYADRLGRKRLLVISAFLMMATGIAFAFLHSFFLLALAAFCGTLSPSTNDNTAQNTVEVPILSQACADGHEQRTHAFAIYNMAAQMAGAFGGLLAALPEFLMRARVTTNVSLGVHALFLLYALLAFSTALLYLRLSPAVEQGHEKPSRERGAKTPSHPGVVPLRYPRRAQTVILKLSSLFFLDAFAGALAVQALFAYWFTLRFGVGLSSLGILFFGVNLLCALSMMVAPRVAQRLGLLQTMIVPHFASNVLLLLVPFMPFFPLAAFCLLARQSLSKMDVPARQAYTMALVPPERRTSAASSTTIARSVAVACGPIATGMMLGVSTLWLGLPYVISSLLEILYDGLLWKTFRHVPLHKKHSAGAPQSPAQVE